MRTRLLLALLCLVLMPAKAAEPAKVLHFELRAQLPLVEAEIDGQQARLILDLGGSAALALRPDWPSSTGHAGESPHQLLLSDGTRTTLSAKAWRKSPIPAGIDGYLGWGYLQRYKLVFDYASREIKLFPPDQRQGECKSPPVALRQLGSLPYAQFTQNGQPLLLGLDSGANQNVLKRASAYAGELGQIRSLEAVSLEQQNLTLGAFRTIELSLPVLDGLLGYEFFTQHRICLDPQGHTLAVDPIAPAR